MYIDIYIYAHTYIFINAYVYMYIYSFVYTRTCQVSSQGPEAGYLEVGDVIMEVDGVKVLN